MVNHSNNTSEFILHFFFKNKMNAEILLKANILLLCSIHTLIASESKGFSFCAMMLKGNHALLFLYLFFKILIFLF